MGTAGTMPAIQIDESGITCLFVVSTSTDNRHVYLGGLGIV